MSLQHLLIYSNTFFQFFYIKCSSRHVEYWYNEYLHNFSLYFIYSVAITIFCICFVFAFLCYIYLIDVYYIYSHFMHDFIIMTFYTKPHVIIILKNINNISNKRLIFDTFFFSIYLIPGSLTTLMRNNLHTITFTYFNFIVNNF